MGLVHQRLLFVVLRHASGLYEAAGLQSDFIAQDLEIGSRAAGVVDGIAISSHGWMLRSRNSRELERE